MTHHAKVPNGLYVRNLKMSDSMSSHNKVLIKPGWYENDIGERVGQSMQRTKRCTVNINGEREAQEYRREKSHPTVQRLQR